MDSGNAVSTATAAIVGRSIRLDGRNTTVVGVMPRDFEYPLFWGNVDIWRPFAASAQLRQDRGNNFLREFGRLKPGVTPDQADAAMKAINQQILAENTNLDQRESVRIEAIEHRQSGDAPHVGVCLRPDVPRAADRLREPGQPAAGADGGAGARVRDSRRHRRRQGTAAQAVADRQPRAVRSSAARSRFRSRSGARG